MLHLQHFNHFHFTGTPSFVLIYKLAKKQQQMETIPNPYLTLNLK